MRHNRLSILLVSCAALISAAACDISRDPFYTSYMTVVADTASESGSVSISHLVSDDSMKVYPVSYSQTLSGLKDGQRIIGTFTIPSGKISDPLNVEFQSIALLQTDSIRSTPANDLTCNDPVTITAAWHSGGVYGAARYVTAVFNIMQAGLYPHSIFLTEDTAAAVNPDADGYYRLRFLHDAGKDPASYQASGIITYPVTGKYAEPDIRGLKISFNTLSSSKDSTVTVRFGLN
ncbi:MAG TPA: hypothetical protein IAC04_05365 [Candidatus Coprenecus stercoravium]|uniref:NigD-like C-terminal domain-containing protein n=1 Tax=Candidatus Coprenecus stercoravium TaxID=2840735 RepID=A0A9D2GRZ8_9BACT|nr:hypothetical protein [Candidatus Coprenecus stercoravium]